MDILDIETSLQKCYLAEQLEMEYENPISVKQLSKLLEEFRSLKRNYNNLKSKYEELLQLHSDYNKRHYNCKEVVINDK